MCINLFRYGDEELLKRQNAFWVWNNSFHNGSKVFTDTNKRDSTSLVPY